MRASDMFVTAEIGMGSHRRRSIDDTMKRWPSILSLVVQFARHIHLVERTPRQASTVLCLLIYVGEGAFQHHDHQVEGGMDADLASWIFS